MWVVGDTRLPSFCWGEGSSSYMMALRAVLLCWEWMDKYSIHPGKYLKSSLLRGRRVDEQWMKRWTCVWNAPWHRAGHVGKGAVHGADPFCNFTPVRSPALFPQSQTAPRCCLGQGGGGLWSQILICHYCCFIHTLVNTVVFNLFAIAGFNITFFQCVCFTAFNIIPWVTFFY